MIPSPLVYLRHRAAYLRVLAESLQRAIDDGADDVRARVVARERDLRRAVEEYEGAAYELERTRDPE